MHIYIYGNSNRKLCGLNCCLNILVSCKGECLIYILVGTQAAVFYDCSSSFSFGIHRKTEQYIGPLKATINFRSNSKGSFK